MIAFETIDAAVHRIAGDAEVLHALDPMRRIPFASGGPPLQSVGVYAADGDQPHWHFVSYGLSRMDDDGDDFGIEITMRVSRGDEESPPQWPVLLLRGLARYVRETHTPLSPGDTFGNGAPITHTSGSNPYDETTGLTELLCGLDPELGVLPTENGNISFVQVFGLHEAEFLAAQRWVGDRMWSLFAEENPLMVTDPWRDDAMEDDDFAERVRLGITEDGSSLGSTLVPGLSWEPHPDDGIVAINIARPFIEEFAMMLEGRTVHGRDFFASSERRLHRETVLIQAGEPQWHVDEADGYLAVSMSPDAAADVIEQLRAEPVGYIDLGESGARIWVPAPD